MSTVPRRQVECATRPSFSSSTREPSLWRTTETYWYGDSVSKSRPDVCFTAPGGTSRSAATRAAGSSALRPSRSAAANARSVAVPTIVLSVPKASIVTSAETKVPRMLPTVESA